TNLATLKDWPLLITVVDLIWGSVLCALVARVSYAVFPRSHLIPGGFTALPERPFHR
ncbi:MAG TPA: DUF2177 family protein, partial [bacterium]|nr:DUF2177 family protein [bacterium]